MNRLVSAAIASAIGGFIAFLLVERFTSARESGTLDTLAAGLRLPGGTPTIFDATQTETVAPAG